MSFRLSAFHMLGAAAVVAAAMSGASADTRTAATTAMVCKAAPETATGSSPDHALKNWTKLTMATYGSDWSQWPSAQDREVVTRPFNGSVVFQAMGKPCQASPTG